MTQIVNPGVRTTTFKYDPFGRRIYKQSPSFTGSFLYEGSNLIETVNGSGSEIASYAQGQNIDEPLAELRSGAADYYETDALGSITSLSSSSGTLANTYTYDSFGNLTASTGTVRDYFQYTGREFDPETGIYYYRARYFDPSIGRFLSEDPIKLKGGIDFYAYVKNRSINRVDPMGLAGAPSNPPSPPQRTPIGRQDASLITWLIRLGEVLVAKAVYCCETLPLYLPSLDQLVLVSQGHAYSHAFVVWFHANLIVTRSVPRT